MSKFVQQCKHVPFCHSTSIKSLLKHVLAVLTLSRCPPTVELSHCRNSTYSSREFKVRSNHKYISRKRGTPIAAICTCPLVLFSLIFFRMKLEWSARDSTKWQIIGSRLETWAIYGPVWNSRPQSGVDEFIWCSTEDPRRKKSTGKFMFFFGAFWAIEICEVSR